MGFVINWQWQAGARAYCTKRGPNYRPYVSDPYDPDTKVWQTRKGAEQYLARVDPNFASKCVIEEINDE